MTAKFSDATDQDLEWFDLENYHPLESASLATWSTLIRDRVMLTHAINSSKNPHTSDYEYFRQYCLEQFDKIKKDPLTPLGFTKRILSVESETNTKTVNSISTKRLRFLANSIEIEVDEKTIADLQLQKSENYPLSQYAHVMVNLHASSEDIKRDFAIWLKKYRKMHSTTPSDDHRNKTKIWYKNKVLQCKDLLLFEAITDKRVIWTRIIAMIDVDDQVLSKANQDHNRIKNLRQQIDQIFQDEICDILDNAQN
ncbi:DUF6387 family protein [Undibacterium sp. SXout7W]|uniref:DUF6387 family protein n=1 Tax=Undibacterium sp. SXout7W TaxID=3413049 RepID=UPI003BF2F3FB